MANSKHMHPNQIENLCGLPPKERYEYFIRYCADFEEVWGLTVGADNWVIFKGPDGDEVFPVWPHHDLAETCLFEEHKEMGAKPQSISLDAFMQTVIPEMASANVYFGIFFDRHRQGLAIAGNVLQKDLEEEIADVWE